MTGLDVVGLQGGVERPGQLEPLYGSLYREGIATESLPVNTIFTRLGKRTDPSEFRLDKGT